MASFIRKSWDYTYETLRLGKLYSYGKSGVSYLGGLAFKATITSMFVAMPLFLANDLERGTLMNIIGTLYGLKVTGPEGSVADPNRLPVHAMQGT